MEAKQWFLLGLNTVHLMFIHIYKSRAFKGANLLSRMKARNPAQLLSSAIGVRGIDWRM
jgi:hypothetical protein